ncbi:FIST signal transduction protein [Legionella waltersii]|uniref:FIST N domain protein n=1 Tax=Legionella waltersii TaxID=66969 RepID=A0A0W1A070_9GAMM|nr:FIST N-terminal domain-containing protein [Legionella waltersii]KTD74724.1 FIST N domain protein [Legionella waltersii]SNV00086.1 Uncharacterized conserved protein [Legionella waltersii]
MDIRTFQYIHGKGWLNDTLPSELDSEQTLVLIFGSSMFWDFREPISRLAQQFKKSKIIGCSTSGEILGGSIFDSSLTVVVVRFYKTTLRLVKAKLSKTEDSFKTGQYILSELNSGDLRGIFILSDGLLVNGTNLVDGLTENVTNDLIVTGGLAGDGSEFKHTWTICNGKLLENHVVAVGFYGEDISIGHASKGGWDIFGPKRRITRSEGNILYELDYQPALKLYKDYLGERSAELPASGLLYPLAISDINVDTENKLVRTILGINEQNQSLIFAGEMPTGYFAQLMRANFDRLIDSAGEAAQHAKIGITDPNKPVLSLAISCVGRRLLLGERTEEEVESILELLPLNSVQTGFYSYGEISPTGLNACNLHNQTMTLTLIQEK